MSTSEDNDDHRSIDDEHFMSPNEGSSTRMPFFADATLDLEEAHDIADTPEATRPQFDMVKLSGNRMKLQVPTLKRMMEEDDRQIPIPDDVGNNNNNTNNNRGDLDDDSGIEEDTNNNSTGNLDLVGRLSSSTTENKDKKFSRITGKLEMDISVTPSRKPRWPRDIPWMIIFFLFVPSTLFYTSFKPRNTVQLAQHPLSFATLHAITWTIIAVIIVSRWLYRSPAGGEGDDIRFQAANIMVTLAPCSVAVYAAITITVWIACPKTRWAAFLPAFYTIRDVYSFRRWSRRTPQVGAGYASRIAFFQAIVCMALDILSRSLRRASFYRVLSALLLLQLILLLWWRAAILGSLSSGTSWITFFLTLFAGKWATATNTRVLTFLASAGVMNWCAQQAAIVSNQPPPSPITNGRHRKHYGGGHDDLNSNQDENSVDDHRSLGSVNSIPEAYRTVDASVYQSVVDVDDVLDDDYDDLEEEVMLENTNGRRTMSALDNSQFSTSSHHQRETVKSILWTGITINFGSIAHCGLLGGLAQFVWSQVRKAEFAQWVILTRARNNSNNSNTGFQGMQIGNTNVNAGMFTGIWNKILILARRFVRNHSDLAMTHVAIYYKGYVRAAKDVATIIDESGLEPILHEDITTHMCTCIGGSVTGVIVLITTYLLLHQRKNHSDVNDFHVVENMLIAYILSYNLIFTVLEPLRAAIKAIYVSFAQSPRCISQAYPLIHHRLSRLSDNRVS